jgi:hypothetical protein
MPTTHVPTVRLLVHAYDGKNYTIRISESRNKYLHEEMSSLLKKQQKQKIFKVMTSDAQNDLGAISYLHLHDNTGMGISRGCPFRPQNSELTW